MTSNAGDAPQLHSPGSIDAAIAHALERPPVVAIPTDFAAHVRAALPARPLPSSRPRAARLAATGATAASLIALCWLARLAAPNFQSLAFDMELALLAELAAIAAWLATAREEL